MLDIIGNGHFSSNTKLSIRLIYLSSITQEIIYFLNLYDSLFEYELKFQYIYSGVQRVNTSCFRNMYKPLHKKGIKI